MRENPTITFTAGPLYARKSTVTAAAAMATDGSGGGGGGGGDRCRRDDRPRMPLLCFDFTHRECGTGLPIFGSHLVSEGMQEAGPRAAGI